MAGNKPSELVTIKDIARIAKVSPATVSRSLNDSTLVSDTTKRRIKAIASSYGFEFNGAARSMVTQRRATIAVILPDEFDEFYVHLYHSGLHNNLRRALERAGLDAIIGFAQNSVDNSDNIVRLVKQKKIDGIIIIRPDLDKKTEDFLREQNFPYVFSHYPPLVDRPDVDWVYVDHERGGMLVGEHFDRCARTKVVVVGDPDKAPEFGQRLIGLQKALSYSGNSAKIEVIPCTYGMHIGYHAVAENLELFRRSNAVFCLNDLLALGVHQALVLHGFSMPKDIFLVGYDDVALSQDLRPSLSTVHQPAEDVAFLTCERLIERIESHVRNIPHRAKHIGLQPRIVIRETSFSCQD